MYLSRVNTASAAAEVTRLVLPALIFRQNCQNSATDIFGRTPDNERLSGCPCGICAPAPRRSAAMAPGLLELNMTAVVADGRFRGDHRDPARVRRPHAQPVCAELASCCFDHSFAGLLRTSREYPDDAGAARRDHAARRAFADITRAVRENRRGAAHVRLD